MVALGFICLNVQPNFRVVSYLLPIALRKFQARYVQYISHVDYGCKIKLSRKFRGSMLNFKQDKCYIFYTFSVG